MAIAAITVVPPPFCFPFKYFKGVGEQNNSFNKLNIYILNPYHVPGTVLGFNLGPGNISSEHSRQTPHPCGAYIAVNGKMNLSSLLAEIHMEMRE